MGLFGAELIRAGGDLVAIDDGGTEVVILDYFATDEAPRASRPRSILDHPISPNSPRACRWTQTTFKAWIGQSHSGQRRRADGHVHRRGSWLQVDCRLVHRWRRWRTPEPAHRLGERIGGGQWGGPRAGRVERRTRRPGGRRANRPLPDRRRLRPQRPIHRARFQRRRARLPHEVGDSATVFDAAAGAGVRTGWGRGGGDARGRHLSHGGPGRHRCPERRFDTARDIGGRPGRAANCWSASRIWRAAATRTMGT